jgi:hypothetical protein
MASKRGKRGSEDPAVPGQGARDTDNLPRKLKLIAGVGRAGLVLCWFGVIVENALIAAVTPLLGPVGAIIGMLFPFLLMEKYSSTAFPMALDYICVSSDYPFKPVGALKYFKMYVFYILATICTVFLYAAINVLTMACIGNGYQTMHERCCNVIWVRKDKYAKFVDKHCIDFEDTSLSDGDDDDEDDDGQKAEPGAKQMEVKDCKDVEEDTGLKKTTIAKKKIIKKN